ncbi:DNA directed RNA polymerase-like protein III subunit Rpc82 [Dendryphion nanum]|uniref:DNA-directed RNA polymerase III subunit RPC3 n=1 Tax=Dendryphion nanum TaxID=256645 RepID=A0A9P9DEN7_9PLEO|nr:DNA directed RNA polymerase-like protein III subunit Rpc82 [Dendryphion nanum]
MSYAHRGTPIMAQLCTLLVEDKYGELAQRVFSVLARHGRQSLSSIVRLSYLNTRQIKHGLVILIQQHLVFHSAFLEEEVIYYEVDWSQAYALVRHGTILQAIESRYGAKAANVVQNFITLGHSRVDDLREAYFPTKGNHSDDESEDERTNGAHKNGTKTNGHTTNGTSAKTNGLTNGHADVNGDAGHDTETNSIESIEELDTIIDHLMSEGWLICVDASQYLSPDEIHIMIQRDVINEEHDGKKPTSAKGKENLVFAINQRKRGLREDWCRVPKSNPRKRSAADPDLSGTIKRLKRGALEWSTRETKNTMVVLNGQLVLRVNPEKVSVVVRTDELVRLVERRLGHLPAKIYEIMLRLIEPKIPRCYEPWPDPPLADDSGAHHEINAEQLVTAKDVAKKLSEPQYIDLDIFEGLDPHAVARLTKNRNPRSHVEHGRLWPPIDPRDLDPDDRTRIVDCHIKKLSDDPFHFVTWHSNPGFSRWQIEFEEISKAMIQHEIENTIMSRGTKGRLGVMVIRALRKKGRLDERQLCNTMMMPASDFRQIANEMVFEGYIQTQEIPRVDRREAKLSTHLLWYDVQRARDTLLDNTYKGMVRIMQRISYEKEQVQDLLRKAERSDVVGNEEKWLAPAEISVLRKWQATQEQLILQLIREDNLVAVLRDLVGPLVTS